MQRWGQYLAEAPPTLWRLIAAHQRVSMPRRCAPEERLARLRQAVCRAPAARAAFFSLSPEERAAVQDALAAPAGARRNARIAALGSIRPLTALRADRTPQSLAERLLLLGWLLPRPAAPQHPAAYLLAPELRRWLPRPLTLTDAGPAPAAPALPSALRAATTIILSAARQPLPLRRDGLPTAAALRRLRLPLAPLPADEADALASWLLPLLADCDLLAPHGSAAAVGPAARRFLDATPAVQLATLRTAWVQARRPERWLRRLRVCTRGVAWPALRRRLLSWAAALPPGRSVALADSYPALRAALGPLADSDTHRLRPAGRSPWQPRRAEAVWQAAALGPLAWLGALAVHAQAAGVVCIYQPSAAEDRPPGGAWLAGDPGELTLAHAAVDGDLLDLQPFAFPVAADATATRYRLSPASIAAAVTAGHPLEPLRALLERRAGPLPAGWQALLAAERGLQLLPRAVLLGDSPQLIAAVSRRPAVRRQIEARLAPGVALIRPGCEAALTRALTRAGVSVEMAGCRAVGVVGVVGARQPDSPTDQQPDIPTPQHPDTDELSLPGIPDNPHRHTSLHMLNQIRQAICRRRALRVRYRAADDTLSERWIQPLSLERHGDRWLLDAYCLLRQAERCFRVDRIEQLQTDPPPRQPAPPRTATKTRRAPPAPRVGFFSPPPDPPAGSPLVRVWLEE